MHASGAFGLESKTCVTEAGARLSTCGDHYGDADETLTDFQPVVILTREFSYKNVQRQAVCGVARYVLGQQCHTGCCSAAL
jgi:hypothetical protein